MPIAHACTTAASPSYQRREPETTCLYGIVERNLGACLSQAQEKCANGYGYPHFVEREFRKYLDCGQLRCGFVRVRCDDCSNEKLVAFSCKTRGICPSCTARRMSNTAAHLVDNVLPSVPYRQWVISFPKRVRFLLAKDPALLSLVLDTALKKIFAWQKLCARRMGLPSAMPGAITFVQRFGSLLNLNVHFHSVVPDGVFTSDQDGQPYFRPTPPPSKADVERLLLQIARATEKRIALHYQDTKAGEPPDYLTSLQAQSMQPRPGAFADNDNQATPKAIRCAFLQGYSLHAERIIVSDDRDGLERLCRYGARAPIAKSRLSLDEDGNAIIKLSRPYFDGRTHLRFTQTELMRKLAILIPPPRKHLTRYHGVFAPNHTHRAAIVKLGRPEPEMVPSEDKPAPKPRRSLPWAMLLRRVFAIDVLQCQDCGGRMNIIAIVPASDASEAIRGHLALGASAKPDASATGPPVAKTV